MKNLQKISITCFFSLFFLCAFVFNANAQSQAYYYGDTLNYRSNIIIATTNNGYLELFKFVKGKITKVNEIYPLVEDSASNKIDGQFFDVSLMENNGELYAYLVDGRFLYKYKISNLANPELISRKRDNSWDWFTGVEKRGDTIATIGLQNMKIWNQNLEVINSYRITNALEENISFGGDNKYVFDFGTDNFKTYNASSQKLINNLEVDAKEKHFRRVFYDEAKDSLFLADDSYLKNFVFNKTIGRWEEKSKFKHSGNTAYDVVGSTDGKFVYFSDGVGIVKAERNKLKPVKWVYANIPGEKRGWAQGIKLVKDGSGDKIIVFNTNNILVLDENLKEIGYYRPLDDRGGGMEKVWLNLDKSLAFANTDFVLYGGGFGPNEKLTIRISSQEYTATTDKFGKLKIVIKAIKINETRIDIKVNGQASGLKYSTVIEIR